MTDPFATPDPQAPEPTPCTTPRIPQAARRETAAEQPAPVLYGESVRSRRRARLHQTRRRRTAPADPSAAAFNAPAWRRPAAADQTAAFRAPAPAVPAYTTPTYPAPAPVDPTAAFLAPRRMRRQPCRRRPPPPAWRAVADVPPVPAASYTTAQACRTRARHRTTRCRRRHPSYASAARHAGERLQCHRD